jgi:hypothetical protein
MIDDAQLQARNVDDEEGKAVSYPAASSPFSFS